jgi:hypothetical protein
VYRYGASPISQKSCFGSHVVHTNQKMLRPTLLLLLLGFVRCFRGMKPTARVAVPVARREQEGVARDAEIVPARTVAVNPVYSSSTYASRLALIEQLQGGLERLSKVVPKPLLYSLIAVVSGLLFFEMSRFISTFSIPVLLVLGAGQSIKEKLDELASGPRVVESVVVADDAAPSEAVVTVPMKSPTDDIEQKRARSGEKLKEISQRISDASGDIREAIMSASSLRDKISAYQERLDSRTASNDNNT